MSSTGHAASGDISQRRDFAIAVVKRLRDAGFQALWAGGCVRDLLMGHPPSDYDVATDAHPSSVMRIFPRTVPVGVSFGVVRVLGPRHADEIEVATFRSDDAYVDGRRPASVTFGTAEVDASRRDFTINGMFLDPLDHTLLDYVGGRADLEAGLVRAIGDPVARFVEDKLRLLRAVRFAARFGFEIEERTFEALSDMAEQVHVVAPERIAQELRKMLVDESRVRSLTLARQTGLLAAILPELVPLAELADEGQTAVTLWDQTLLRLKKLPSEPSFRWLSPRSCSKPASPWPTSPTLPDASTPAINPSPPGSLMPWPVTCAFPTTNASGSPGSSANQHAFLNVDTLPIFQLKRLLASPGAAELIDLHRARGYESEADGLLDYLRTLPDGPINPPPLLSGNDLKELGLTPGPHFAELLDRVRDGQLGNDIQTREQALEAVRGWASRGSIDPPGSTPSAR